MIEEISPAWQWFVWVTATIVASYGFLIGELIAISRKPQKIRPLAYNHNPRKFWFHSLLLATVGFILAFLLVLTLKTDANTRTLAAVYMGASLPGILLRGSTALVGTININKERFN